MAPQGMKPLLRFVKMTEKAIAPTKGSPLAAGYDLYSAYDVTVPPKGKALIKTDIQVAVPSGCYGRVAPRSGLAVKNFIDVGAGVVDEDYRGNLGVVLFNFSDVEFVVKHGDRVAQLICERIEYPELEECQSLDETERGAGGFGSTGVSKENVEQTMDVDAEKIAAVVDATIDGNDGPISPRKRQALSAKDEN